jgi:pentatricopeptide repeat protein
MTIPPDEYIFSSIFKICAQLGDSQSIQFGQSILETVPIKYQNDTILLNSALHMLMQGGNISTSEQLFVRMKKDTSSYRIMMGGMSIYLHFMKYLRLFSSLGYVMNNKPQQAIDLFFQTEKKEGFIYVFFLNACAQLKSEKALALGKQVLSQLFAGYHSKNSNNEILYAALDMFVKCDDIENAESLFTRLKRNVICYGSLMKMYNLKGQSIKTLSLFEQMKIEKIKPNEIIYTLIINALSQLGDLSMCELVLTQLPTNLMTNLWIQNALIDMWVSFLVVLLID